MQQVFCALSNRNLLVLKKKKKKGKKKETYCFSNSKPVKGTQESIILWGKIVVIP